jgi:hypothetical protein
VEFLAVRENLVNKEEGKSPHVVAVRERERERSEMHGRRSDGVRWKDQQQ